MEAPKPAPTPIEPRQRWRVAFRRRPDAPPLPQREQVDAWHASLLVSGLPFAGLDADPPRPRVVFAAPLAIGVAAERDLVDLFLTRLLPISEVRARLAGSLPAGHELVDLHDVWLGEPALSGRVAAAVYRVEVAEVEAAEVEAAGGALDAGALGAAARRLLAAASLPRTREKGGRTVSYDLRPLLDDVEVLGPPRPAGAAAVLRVRTRFDPERGVGRPEEVIGALGEAAGVVLAMASVVRERLVLGGESGEDGDGVGRSRPGP